MTKALSTRVDLVEQGFKTLTHLVNEMRTEQKTERKETLQAIAALRDDLGSVGYSYRPFPFKEVSTAVGTTVFIIGSAIGVLNWWYDARAAVLNDTVSALSRSADPGEMAVIKYRLSQIEAYQKMATR